MENKNLENLFEKLKGQFDIEVPGIGHENRFLEKLNASNGIVSIGKKRKSWLKPLSIAASILILCSVGIGLYQSNPSLEKQVAQISPEVSRTEFYFASLIEQQVSQLISEGTPETRQIIDDTMVQLKKLENNHSLLEKDLIKGGNSKLILSAMITNFQTRIDLLQDVLDKIETIKNLKNYDNATITI